MCRVERQLDYAREYSSPRQTRYTTGKRQPFYTRKRLPELAPTKTKKVKVGQKKSKMAKKRPKNTFFGDSETRDTRHAFSLFPYNPP